MEEPAFFLKEGREKSLLRRHPWVFSGAILRTTGKIVPGSEVAIRNAKGEFLARGAASPTSQIAARVWTFEESENIDRAFFRKSGLCDRKRGGRFGDGKRYGGEAL